MTARGNSRYRLSPSRPPFLGFKGEIPGSLAFGTRFGAFRAVSRACFHAAACVVCVPLARLLPSISTRHPFSLGTTCTSPLLGMVAAPSVVSKPVSAGEVFPPYLCRLFRSANADPPIASAASSAIAAAFNVTSLLLVLTEGFLYPRKGNPVLRAGAVYR